MVVQDGPLTLPEILINIFDTLESDQATLAAAIRVNKLWFDCGIRVLWREATPVALADVGPTRAQIYASKITSLQFSSDEDGLRHAGFIHLQFSSLKSITLDSYRPPHDNSYAIQQYFSPALQRLAFYGGTLNEALLTDIRDKCWRLKTLLIDSPGEEIQPAFFTSFISQYATLEHMTFMFGAGHLITEELMEHLAQRSNLQSLSIGKPWPTLLSQKIAKDIPDPFTTLKKLQLKLASAAVQPLVSMLKLKSIKNLGLSIQDAEEPVLCHIASLSSLTSLFVQFDVPTELSKADILSVGALHSLTELTIAPNIVYDNSSLSSLNSGFSHDDFDKMCSNLHQLRTIRFDVQADLSAAILLSLSKYCPLLKDCRFPYHLDIPGLKLETHQTVLFPNLISLDIGSFLPPSVAENDNDITR